MNSCKKVSNNKYFNCPPRMADGRHFTDYRPRCKVTNELLKDSGSKGSHNLRMYLTRNTNTLLKKIRKNNSSKNGCGPCQEPPVFSEIDTEHVNKELNCCADNNSLFNYYGHVTSKAQGELIPRKIAIPGGGDVLSGGDPVACNF